MAPEVEPGGPPAPTAPSAGASASASTPVSWQEVISAEATRQKVDPRLALAVANAESNFNPDAHSPKGAHGLMQLMPATATKWKVDATDPVQNIRGGVSELKSLLDLHKGDVTLALRRYNGSPTATDQQTQPYVDKVLKQLKPSTPAPAAGQATPPTPGEDPNAGPPMVGKPPPAPPPETWRDWAIRQGKGVVSAFDPRTSTGRQNLAGGAGAAALSALAVASAPVSVPLLGLGAGAAGVVGAFAGGEAANLGEQIVGNAPPSTASALEAGGIQGFQEALGRGVMWGVQGIGRRIIAGRVGRYAAKGLEAASEALSASKSYTLGKLQDALDASQTLLRQTKATTREATAQARTSTSQMVTDAANRAKQGVKQAEAQGAAGVEAATAPYARIVGTPPPSAAGAGRAVNAVIQEGGAAKARTLAGQAVDQAAESGPPVDITALKAQAQQVIEGQIRPPAESFPRKTPEGLSNEEIAAQGGFSPKHIEEMRAQAAGQPSTTGVPTTPEAQARAKANLDQLTQAVQSAQGEAGQETLKHPAMGILSRIMNAEDTVPFKDAHLWKVELDNSLRNTRDQSVRSQVANLTQKFTGSLRQALREAGHQPYEEATAAYAKIAPLYTKGLAPRLKKLAVENPEAIVTLLTPGQPTKAKMLVDLLTTQAAEGGDAEAGQAALNAVQAAWVRKRVIDGGIEKLGDRIDKIPQDFRQAFLSTPQATAVLDRLQLIHTAFKTAQLTSESGVEAIRQAGQRSVEATRAAALGIRAQTRQAGAAQVEQTAQAILPAKQALRTAKTGFATAEAGVKEQQGELARSTLAARMRPEASTQAGADLLRSAAMLATGVGGITHSYYGGLSLMRLLKGPTASDLVHWAASSPAGTRAFVAAMTSSAPGAALADLVRASGILEETPRKGKATAQATGTPPPRGAAPTPAPAGVGTPPPS
jgi:hypothetical protein